MRGFVFTLFVLFSAGIIVDNDFFEIFRMVGFFWGISLVVKYFKLKGMPGTNGWLSDDWFDWILNRYPLDAQKATVSERPGEPGEDYDPLWKDKDLV